MNIYFTSDWHLSHANIIEYTNRPFKTSEEMNSIIIKNCNERVKKGDLVFLLIKVEREAQMRSAWRNDCLKVVVSHMF